MKRVYSAIVRDEAIGALTSRARVTQPSECPACHRTPLPVVNLIDYELTSWEGGSAEWLLVAGAHVVSKRVRLRIASAEPGVVFRDAAVHASGVALFPSFQVLDVPSVQASDELLYSWFCETCLETAWNPTPVGQRCLQSGRLTLSRAAWGELRCGRVAFGWWPWLLVDDELRDQLVALNVKNVDYVEVELV